MKKNLLTVGLLLLAFSAHAQVLTHVDKSGIFYVGKDALVYNGGGLQTKDNGLIENHGSIMVDGVAGDVLKTLDNGNVQKPYGTDLNIVNKVNEPNNYATWNNNENPPVGYVPQYTYGQIFIKGLNQADITGFVNEEFRNPHHGERQQIAIPFFGKTASTLNQIGQTFNTDRYGGRAIMTWNNARVVFNHLTDLNIMIGNTGAQKPYAYYMIGNKGIADFGATMKTIIGRPVSDMSDYSISLTGAGAGMDFGAGGNRNNEYNGKYNTYLQDAFAVTRNNAAWTADYGKNIYQIGNPYLTNLDLSKIGTIIPGINGIRFEPSNTVVGQGSQSIKFVTFAAGVPTGDVDYMMVRPMSTFVIKMLPNATGNTTLNLKDLRSLDYKFGNTVANPAAKYMKSTTAKTVSSGTVKQLAVIGLNSGGIEVERAYYVVSNDLVSGNSVNATAQVGTTNLNNLGTWEEDPQTGGIDTNTEANYWLYINEANEKEYKGKPIKLSKYTGDIVKFKFQILENGVAVADKQHALASGDGFYFKGPDGVVKAISQNEVIAASGNAEQDYSLYFGKPSTDATLGGDDLKVPARTFVAYNPEISDYVVLFDPKWKKAEVKIFDMSGKLVSSERAINASSEYKIKLNSAAKGIYVVVVTSDSGEVVQTKITKQ